MTNQMRGTLLASEANSQAQRTSKPFMNRGEIKGLVLIVTISSGQGTFAYSPAIEVEREDGTWHRIWEASAALAADGTVDYEIALGSASGGGEAYTEQASIGIPWGNWRFVLDADTASANNDATTAADFIAIPA